MEDFSTGFEGYLSLANFLNISIEKSMVAITVKVKFWTLSVAKNIDASKNTLCMQKKSMTL